MVAPDKARTIAPHTSTVKGPRVTDRIALTLGLCIVAAILADIGLNDGRSLLFLMVKFADMVEWLAFWR